MVKNHIHGNKTFERSNTRLTTCYITEGMYAITILGVLYTFLNLFIRIQQRLDLQRILII